jgi:hypothetical protein
MGHMAVLRNERPIVALTRSNYEIDNIYHCRGMMHLSTERNTFNVNK